MNVTWDTELKPHQTASPVLHHQMIDLPPGLFVPDEETLAAIFPGDGHSLKTWGRTEGTKVNDPHWIGVRKPTPLHIDPAYPRYSHHVVLRCDDLWLWGLDREALPVSRGMFFILDGHSPHQLTGDRRPKGAPAPWYVACSLDTVDAPLPPDVAIPIILRYATTHRLDD